MTQHEAILTIIGALVMSGLMALVIVGSGIAFLWALGHWVNRSVAFLWRRVHVRTLVHEIAGRLLFCLLLSILAISTLINPRWTSSVLDELSPWEVDPVDEA